MRQRIVQAYETVKADDTQRQVATQAALQALRSKQTTSVLTVRRGAALVTAVALAVLATVGCRMFMQPVAVIRVSAEPATELQINCFDRVIAVASDDKTAVTSVRFASYIEAVDVLTDGEETIDMTVFSSDTARCEAMLNNLQKEQKGICKAGNADVMEQANRLEISCGKYEAFLEWRALDSTATVEQARAMTMREIREHIASLHETHPDDTAQEDETAQHGQTEQTCTPSKSNNDEQSHAQNQKQEHGNSNGAGKQKGKLH